jgi:Rod binding domain-containing protein
MPNPISNALLQTRGGLSTVLPADGPQSQDSAKAVRAAKEFEAVFLAEMLRPMVAGLTPEAPFGGGIAEDMWRSLQADEYGKAVVRSGGIGVSDAVAKQILSLQEHQEVART